MKILILGDGCAKCVEVKENVHKAVADLKIDADIVTTMDPEVIAQYHALSLPVLVIDGIPHPISIRMTLPEVTQLLQKAL